MDDHRDHRLWGVCVAHLPVAASALSTLYLGFSRRATSHLRCQKMSGRRHDETYLWHAPHPAFVATSGRTRPERIQAAAQAHQMNAGHAMRAAPATAPAMASADCPVLLPLAILPIRPDVRTLT
jgi:hypothetical protein